MIGSGLTRFHPYPQDGKGMLEDAWRTLRSQGPTILKEVLRDTAMAGLNGGTSRGGFNLTGGIKAAKQGAKRSLKRKATQVLQKAVAKRIKKDLFGSR